MSGRSRNWNTVLEESEVATLQECPVQATCRESECVSCDLDTSVCPPPVRSPPTDPDRHNTLALPSRRTADRAGRESGGPQFIRPRPR
ncbi:hypothetical protein J6590_025180 [Homalodisca vitripennis]|nr:hypothetical protein J6590_025180 [Homalodisca vitripennis]